MPRVFLPGVALNTGPAKIKNDKARYISTVLRCKRGDRITITDDKGHSYSARITSATRKEVVVEIIEPQEFNTESSLHMTLLQSILKGSKMDLVVQKATELGVKEIIPVITERSQIRETRKILRWRKIAEEASIQAGRNFITEIREITAFEELFVDPYSVSGKCIIFWEEGGKKLSDILRRFNRPDKINLFTGPEGGFSEREITTASEHGFVTATLGKRILRAETASIAALSIVQYELGDLDLSRK